MANNFHELESKWAEMLPSDLEHNLTRQVSSFSFFGKVVDLFVPNAFQTVVKMIGGDKAPSQPEGPGRYGETSDWRVRPSKGTTGPR